MDAEHEMCEAALKLLAEQRSPAALQGVLDAYTEHFAHEEALLEQHVYASVDKDAGGFSMLRDQRRSHYADHQRLLTAIKALHAQPYATYPAAEVSAILRDFEKHAGSYDASYAAPLSAALAAATA